MHVLAITTRDFTTGRQAGWLRLAMEADDWYGLQWTAWVAYQDDQRCACNLRVHEIPENLQLGGAPACIMSGHKMAL